MSLLRDYVQFSRDCHVDFFIESHLHARCFTNLFKRTFTHPHPDGGHIRCAGRFDLLYPTLHDIHPNDVKGIVLALLGTAITAIGDASSARNAKKLVDPIYANAIGFTAGGILLGSVVWFQGQAVSIPPSVSYLSALLYLTLLASFGAWLFYLKLVEKIGGAKSGYMVALFPAIGGIASVLIGESDPSMYLILGCLSSCIGAAVALGAGTYFRKTLSRKKLPVRARLK